MIANQRTQFIRRRFRAVAFHTLLFVSMFATAAAQATYLPVQGGPGGIYFKRECSGDFVVGVYVRSGDWVDAIGLRCAAFDQAQGKFKYPPWNTPYYGSGFATIQEHICPNDRYVSGIMFNITPESDHPFVNFVQVTCSPISGSGGPTWGCLQTGQGCNGQGAFVLDCPAGEAATGIQGRTGTYVDALGLICGPKPAIIPVGVQPVKHPRTEACPDVKGDEVPAEWSEMLNAHNERRRQHCVPPLTWSNELAGGAQAYATACILDQHGSTGENMANAWSETNGTPDLPALKDRDAFEQSWYCEFINYHFDDPVLHTGFSSQCQGDVNGHFTQIVWKDTCRLGCGRATCTIDGHKGTHWVCRYGPAGNDPNQSVLKQQVFPRECQ
jgi:Cysteine-rich secretory protein family